MKKKSLENLKLKKAIISNLKKTIVGGNQTIGICVSVYVACKSKDCWD